MESAEKVKTVPSKKSKSLPGKILDRSLNVTFIISGSIFFFMMLVMVVHVLGRYLIARPVPWAVEFSEYLLAIAIFLAAAWVLKEEAHVTVDILVNHMKPRTRYLVNAITSWFIAAFLIFLTYWGASVTFGHIRDGQVIWKTVLTPIWILDIFVPIATILLFFQCLRRGQRFLKLSRNIPFPDATKKDNK